MLTQWPTLAKRYLAADEAGRRPLLANTVDQLPLPTIAEARALSTRTGVHRTVIRRGTKAKQDIAHYIVIFSNRRRLHSALGYRTPHEVRIEYVNQQVAARNNTNSTVWKSEADPKYLIVHRAL